MSNDLILDVPPLRLGLVPYLNVQPMVYGLHESFPQLQLQSAVPRKLERMLANDQINLGIVPVFSAFMDPARAIYAAPVIGSDGPVYSVLIVSQQPMEQLHRIWRDPHSLTSNALAAVLLKNHWKLDLSRLADAISPELRQGEGRVIIGDPAIRERRHFQYVYDLGEAWKQWTGLPFVFAAWIGRDGQHIGQLREALMIMVKRNMQRLPEVVHSYATLHELPAEELVVYLRDYLTFNFDAREHQAIERFHAECRNLGLTATECVRWAE
mgnify:CR=1 FL=1